MSQDIQDRNELVEKISGIPLFGSNPPDEARRIAQIIIHGGFLIFILTRRGIEYFTNREDTTPPAREIYYVHSLVSRNPDEPLLFGHFLNTIEASPDELHPITGGHLDIISFPLDRPIDSRVQSIELLTPEDIQDAERRLQAIIDKRKETIEELIVKLPE